MWKICRELVFQNISSTNCIEAPSTGYIIVNYNGHNTLFPCYYSCSKCETGGNYSHHNCTECKPNYYFDGESYNCVRKIDGYYIDYNNRNGTLFPCYYTCSKCDKEGNYLQHNCIGCKPGLYLDDEKKTNCVKDDPECEKGCAKCYKNGTDSNYNQISPDKRCKRCSFKKGYYPLEKYSIDQSYVSCYPRNNPPSGFFFFNNKTNNASSFP